MDEGEGHEPRHGGAAPPADGPPVVPGFELGALLARGGTSEVWAGVSSDDGRRVAVKVVGADLDELEVAAREAALSAAAASAHVVTVDALVPLVDGRTALVMPHVRGGPLDRLVRARGHLGPGEVVTVLAPLASALGRLHDLGVVHGDVSPGNVLLDLDGRPLLGDLGLGHVVGEVSPGVWGTDGYVAPEVLMGSDPGPAADVYALGALGWLCLSGQVPGQPGLRPALADVCRAGEGAAPVVEVLQSAVSPHVVDRPTAHELAWRLFHAARPDPLHLVRGDDETSAVTYRLRAAAGRPPEDAAPARWGGPLAARLRALVAGQTALPALPAGQGTRGDGPRHAPADGRPPTGRRTVVVVALSLLVAAVLTVGVVLGAVRSDVPVQARTSPVVGEAGRPGATGSRAVSPPPVAGPGSDPRTEPDAPRRRPAELLAALADARALAFREATAAHLHGADAPGSAVDARDRAAVTELGRSGLRYVGLRYEVDDVVHVSSSRDRAELRGRIGTSAYDVVGATGGTPRSARAGQEVVVRLAWQDVGWRVTDVLPAGDALR